LLLDNPNSIFHSPVVTIMRSTLLVKEPQPTTAYPYQHTGIGGAGNVRHVQPPTSLAAPYVPQRSSPSLSRFSTGRGGVGNIPRAGDYRPMFSLDEEVDRRDKPAPVTYHTGRGGEGNLVHGDHRRDSVSSEGSKHSQTAKGSLDVAREWLKKW
jgi:hypothetical protein